MEQKGNRRDLKVFVRFLPSMDICRENIKYNLDTNTIYLRCKDGIHQQDGQRPTSPQFWSFHPDRVFYNASQEDVYIEAAKGILENSVNTGTDAVIMAFGQVGSGKTFTMMGNQSKLYQRGLVPRFISHVIQESNRSDLKVVCEISFVEIIGQKITDLFTGTHLKSEDIKRVSTVPLTSNRRSLERLFRAESCRNMAGYGNCKHGIVTFHIRTLDLLASHAEYKLVKVHFVDLAGIDSFGETQDSGKKATEIGLANVTKSLLDQCIRQLEKSPVHVVSDLALRFLGNSLSGDSTLRFISHVKMSRPDLTVSLSLLRFGARIAGIKFDKKTSDPSSSHTSNQEMLRSIRARMQLQAMLCNKADDQTLEERACKERVAFLRSKAHEYLEQEDLAKKTDSTGNRQNTNDDRLAEPLSFYDPPVLTNFDFENDPTFNYHNCTQEEFLLQYGSQPRMKSQNDLQAQVESHLNMKSRSSTGSRRKAASKSRIASRIRINSKSRINSRLRMESRTPIEPRLCFETTTELPPPVIQRKIGSLLQNLISLKITREVALETDSNTQMNKAELLQLFHNKINRQRDASSLSIIPPSISKSATVISKRMSLKSSSSQGTLRKTSSKKSLGSVLSSSSLRDVGLGNDLTLLRERNSSSLPRDIDERGISVGPAGLYQFQGRIAALTKQARAMEIDRHGVVKIQLETNPRTTSKVDEVADISKFVDTKESIPIAPVSSMKSVHKEQEAFVKKVLQDVLNSAKEELLQRQTEYFDANRKLEWCRYLFGRANCDLQEVQERRLSLGMELENAEAVKEACSKEVRLAEFISATREEYLDVQQALLIHHRAVNKAMIEVQEAQINLDEFIKETDIQRPDMSVIDVEDEIEAPNDEEPKMVCLYDSLQKES